MFFHLTQALHGEVEALAYPRMALLGFALALGAGNVLAVVQAGVARGPRGRGRGEVSFYYVVEEIAVPTAG